MREQLRVAMTLEQCWHRVPGGTGVAAVHMAEAVDARNDVEVIGIAARHGSPPPGPFRPEVPIQHLPLPRLLLYESWHRLRRPQVQRATGEVDVIHATSLAIPPRSAPLVVTIHDLLFLRYPTMFTRRGMGFFRRGLDLSRRDADLVVCPSESTRRDCIEAGFSEDALRIVPMGVEMTRATDAEVDTVRKRYGLPRPYALWAGTLEPRKNLRGLVDAFARIDADADLVLVGPTGWQEDVIEVTAPVRDRAKILGFIPQSDLTALYAGASVFCFPSLAEGFGFPVLEAMTQGVPVITSRGTSTEEISGDAALLVDPRDPEAITVAIDRVLHDPELATRLAAAGPARAASYSWERTAELLASIYAEAIA